MRFKLFYDENGIFIIFLLSKFDWGKFIFIGLAQKWDIFIVSLNITF